MEPIWNQFAWFINGVFNFSGPDCAILSIMNAYLVSMWINLEPIWYLWDGFWWIINVVFFNGSELN